MAASRDAITADGALVEPRHCAVHLTRRLRVDNAVDTEVLRVLKQLGIDAAVKALMAQTSEISAAQRQLELALAGGTFLGGVCEQITQRFRDHQRERRSMTAGRYH